MADTTLSRPFWRLNGRYSIDIETTREQLGDDLGCLLESLDAVAFAAAQRADDTDACDLAYATVQLSAQLRGIAVAYIAEVNKEAHAQRVAAEARAAGVVPSKADAAICQARAALAAFIDDDRGDAGVIAQAKTALLALIELSKPAKGVPPTSSEGGRA